jgi:hypothetical protein
MDRFPRAWHGCCVREQTDMDSLGDGTHLCGCCSRRVQLGSHHAALRLAVAVVLHHAGHEGHTCRRGQACCAVLLRDRQQHGSRAACQLEDVLLCGAASGPDLLHYSCQMHHALHASMSHTLHMLVTAAVLVVVCAVFVFNTWHAACCTAATAEAQMQQRSICTRPSALHLLHQCVVLPFSSARVFKQDVPPSPRGTAPAPCR